jgi:hypothetical protein
VYGNRREATAQHLMKILVKAGEKCEKLMGRLIVNIPVKDVQADEIWSF